MMQTTTELDAIALREGRDVRIYLFTDPPQTALFPVDLAVRLVVQRANYLYGLGSGMRMIALEDTDDVAIEGSCGSRAILASREIIAMDNGC